MTSYIRKNFKEKDILAAKKAQVSAYLRAKADSKVRDKNVIRRMYKEKNEVKMEEALARAQESAGWRVDELRQEESLAYHMDQAKKEETRKLKAKQILGESSELSDLEKTLKLAYYQKELTNKHAREKLHSKTLEKMEEQAYNLNLKKEEQIRETYDKTIEEANLRKKEMYKQALQDQIIDNHKLKILEHQKRLKETALINDAVRTAIEEDEKVEKQMQHRKELIKEEIETFKKAKAFWAIREKTIQEEEDRKLKEYLELKNEREHNLQLNNLKLEENKIQKQKAVIEKVKQLEGARQEKDRIAAILLNEETRIKNENDEKQRVDKGNYFKHESRQTFLAQLQFKLAQKEEEKRLDRIYAIQMNEKIEQDRLKELEEQRQAKLKKLRYGQELRQGLEDLHRQKFLNTLLSIKEDEGLQAEKARYVSMVNEERRRLINEHAPHLIGFLPAGTIKDEDVPYLKPELREVLKVQNPVTDFH